VSLEHFRFVVLLRSFSRTLATWTAWASVIATRTSVTSAVIAARASLTLVTAWTSVATAWTTLRFYIAFRLLDEGLA
jgi:hypothetical protein